MRSPNHRCLLFALFVVFRICERQLHGSWPRQAVCDRSWRSYFALEQLFFVYCSKTGDFFPHTLRMPDAFNEEFDLTCLHWRVQVRYRVRLTYPDAGESRQRREQIEVELQTARNQLSVRNECLIVQVCKAEVRRESVLTCVFTAFLRLYARFPKLAGKAVDFGHSKNKLQKLLLHRRWAFFLVYSCIASHSRRRMP